MNEMNSPHSRRGVETVVTLPILVALQSRPCSNLRTQAALRGGYAQRTIATLDSKLFLQVWRNYATAEASFEA